MPWNINHRCNMTSPPSEFGAMKAVQNGQKVTRVMCPKCREEFVILGHDMFNEATPVGGSTTGLPPGFLLPKSYRQG